MRDVVVKTVLFLLLLPLVSCKVDVPENVLPPDKMEAVLYDYHLTGSMTTTFASVTYKEKLMYSYVYAKHGITKEIFDSSLVWYNRYPKHIKRIYENLELRLQGEIDVLKLHEGMNYRNVDLDLANLTDSVAELWTGHPVKMLSATPLMNKVQFSYDVPKDSSFVAGDSLSFTFGAAFLPSGGAAVKQDVYAALTLEYSNDSCFMAGTSVQEPGVYAVEVPRNYGSRLKSMSGYVYYFDNDSLSVSHVLLSNISLKRWHPAKTTIDK